MHITQPDGACKRVNVGRCQPLNTKIPNHLWSRPTPSMCVDPRVYVCTRFQVNYSIIAVDILLFVAVVDRRPAAESGSLPPLFAPRILAMSRELLLRFPPRSRPLFLRIRNSLSASIDNLLLHGRLVYLPKYSILKKLPHGTSLSNFSASRF